MTPAPGASSLLPPTVIVALLFGMGLPLVPGGLVSASEGSGAEDVVRLVDDRTYGRMVALGYDAEDQIRNATLVHRAGSDDAGARAFPPGTWNNPFLTYDEIVVGTVRDFGWAGPLPLSLTKPNTRMPWMLGITEDRDGVRIHGGPDEDHRRIDGFTHEDILGAGFVPFGDRPGVAILHADAGGHRIKVFTYNNNSAHRVASVSIGVEVHGERFLGVTFEALPGDYAHGEPRGRIVATSVSGAYLYVDVWTTERSESDPDQPVVERDFHHEFVFGAQNDWVQDARAVALTQHHYAIEIQTEGSSHASTVRVLFHEGGTYGDTKWVTGEGGCLPAFGLSIQRLSRWTEEGVFEHPQWACLRAIRTDDPDDPYRAELRISLQDTWDPGVWDDNGYWGHIVPTALRKMLLTERTDCGSDIVRDASLFAWQDARRVALGSTTRHETVWDTLALAVVRDCTSGGATKRFLEVAAVGSEGSEKQTLDSFGALTARTDVLRTPMTFEPVLAIPDAPPADLARIVVAGGASSAAMMTIQRSAPSVEVPLDPIPFAYLAAPPHVGGLGQDADGPQFATYSGSANSDRRFMEVRFGGILTAEASVKIPLIGRVTVESELRAGGAFGWATGQELEVQISESALGTHEEDQVVYIAATVWRDEYDVIAASDGITGYKVYLDTPKGAPAFRHSAVAEAAWLRPRGLDGHTPGDPGLYPQSPEAARAACHGDQAYEVGPHLADTGKGSSIIALDIQESTFTEGESRFDLDLDVIVKKSFAGDSATVGLGAYAGFTIGESWEIRSFKGMTMESNVGSIPDDFPGETYHWGAVMCKAIVGVQNRHLPEHDAMVWALQHWVPDYNGLGPVVPYSDGTLIRPDEYHITKMEPSRFEWDAPMDLRGTQRLVIEAIGAHDERGVPLSPDVATYSLRDDGEQPQLVHSGIPHRWRIEQQHAALGDHATPWGYFVPHALPRGPLLTDVPVVEQDGSITWSWPEPAHADPGWSYLVTLRDDTGRRWDETEMRERWYRSPPLPVGIYHLDIKGQNPVSVGSDPDLRVFGQSRSINTDVFLEVLLLANDTRPDTGQRVLFEVHTFGNADFASALWTVDGMPLEGHEGATLEWSFASPGVHNVQAVVRDTAGAERTVSRPVSVQNRPAHVSFDFPSPPQTGRPVSIQVHVDDPDGDSEKASFRWDFGEGHRVEHGGADPEYYFSWPGPHVVCVRVTDEHGDDADACRSVYVRNTEPTALILQQEPAFVHQPVRFESASWDPDGAIVHVAWRMDGHVAGGNLWATHVFDAPGTYQGCLFVVDDFGAGNETCIDVVVHNHAPYAFMGATAHLVLTGEPVEFVDGSFDVDGDPLTHEWTFGDGRISTEAAPVHAYADDGTYRVCLTVADPWVTSPWDDCTTIVVENRPPELVWGWGPGDDLVSHDIHFEDHSTDPDGEVVGWHWDFGDGRTAEGRDVRHKYRECGEYQVTLTVTDDDGDTNNTTFVVRTDLVRLFSGRLTEGGLHVGVPGVLGFDVADPQEGRDRARLQACHRADPMVLGGVA